MSIESDARQTALRLAGLRWGQALGGPMNALRHKDYKFVGEVFGERGRWFAASDDKRDEMPGPFPTRAEARRVLEEMAFSALIRAGSQS